MVRLPREQVRHLVRIQAIAGATLSTLLTLACGGEDPAPAAASTEPAADPVATKSRPGRVDFAYPGETRVVPDLPLGAPELRGVQAVVGRTSTPKWAARPQEGPERLRDSNLESQWRCRVKGDQPCAWGVRFKDPTKLSLLHVVGGKQPLEGARLHTEGGYIDLPPLGAHESRYLLLDQALELTWMNLVVETGSVSLSEVELFGTGKARAPIKLDPMRQEAGGTLPSWTRGEDGTLRLEAGACLRVGGVCLERATALYGWPAERFWMAETVLETDCTQHQGKYELIDTETRRRFRLSAAARPPALVHRHKDGLGWAVAMDGTFVAATVDETGEPVEVVYESSADAEAAGFAPRGMTRRAGAIGISEHCPEGFGVKPPPLPAPAGD